MSLLSKIGNPGKPSDVGEWNIMDIFSWGTFKISKRRGQLGYQDLAFIEEVWFGDIKWWVTKSMEKSESIRKADVDRF